MKRLLTLSAIVLGLAIQAGNVSASAFRVTPIRVTFERGGSSSLLTLINESQDSLRFQISAFEWSQDPTGSMKLEPTKEILFFPALLTLEAGGERKVRVSAKSNPGAVEKSYRIFFEELPPLAGSDADQGAQVRILTRMGVPIFLSPTNVVEKGAIVNGRVASGKLQFGIRNEGTVRFSVHGVNVRGTDASGAVVFEQKLDGWYVLAGTDRLYEVALPADVCSRVKAITIEAPTDSSANGAGLLTSQTAVSAESCR
jgi:fimbrial chaperone protein